MHDLATALPSSDFDVLVAAGGSGPLFEKLESSGIKTVKIKFLERDINLAKEVLSLVSLFKILKSERPDIVHLNSSKIGAVGAVTVWLHKLKNKSNAKTIFTVHGWAFNEDRGFLPKIMIFLSQWLTSFLCDKVIVISKHDYRQALKMPLISQEKFSLIPLGINIPENSFLQKDRSRKLISKMIGGEIMKDDIVVGAISELTKNKGLDYLIGAVKNLKISRPDIKCVIIGDGEERESLRNRINSLDLENTVYLTGFLKNACSYLKSFDVFAMPSLKEGLPYVLLEAMSAGLPVAATSVGGVPDMIEHGKGGYLVGPKNQAAFAEALEKTLSVKNSRAVKNTHSEKLRTKFSVGKMLSSTANLYES